MDNPTNSQDMSQETQPQNQPEPMPNPQDAIEAANLSNESPAINEEIKAELTPAPSRSRRNPSQEPSEYIKGVLEALLFVNEKPVTLDQIKKALPTVNANETKKIMTMLAEEYEARKSGMTIVEIAGGYQMLSNPLYASYVRNFYQTKHKEKLSKPALETLAIIAYKQPVSRADIEQIRGVNTDGVFVSLLNKELIKVVGRKEVPGRPFLYGTTKQFLEYFGLKSLESLPKLEELQALQAATEATSTENAEAKKEVPIDPNAGAENTETIAENTKTIEEYEKNAAKDMGETVGESSPIVDKAEEFLGEQGTKDAS
jgi:segregation and condensation protein B